MITKAVILCGGRGTRIRDASETLPKALLPIGGRPILWHIMKSYSQHGITDFVICLGYKGWLIKDFFLNYRARLNDFTIALDGSHATNFRNDGGAGLENWTVTLAETGEDTMTAGRIAAIRPYVQDDDVFLLTYGDGVSDVDIAAVISRHREFNAVATVTAVRPPGRFGELRLDGARVVEFNEKPQAAGGLINGGFFACDAARIWPYLGDHSTTFEQEPLRRMAQDGLLAAYIHEGFWQPMDTLREFELLNALWDADRAPWANWQRA